MVMQEDGADVDRLLNSLNMCRTCSHAKIAHSGTDKYCLDVALTVDGHIHLCSCKEYIPKENLAFLEYKYGKKEGK